jgi:hypothetical protein
MFPSITQSQSSTEGLSTRPMRLNPATVTTTSKRPNVCLVLLMISATLASLRTSAGMNRASSLSCSVPSATAGSCDSVGSSSATAAPSDAKSRAVAASISRPAPAITARPLPSGALPPASCEPRLDAAWRVPLARGGAVKEPPYSLVAPAVRPLTIQRCRLTKITMMGNAMAVETAMRLFQRVPY